MNIRFEEPIKNLGKLKNIKIIDQNKNITVKQPKLKQLNLLYLAIAYNILNK